MNDEIDKLRMRFDQIDKDLGELYHSYAASFHLSDTAFFILYVLWDVGEGCTQSDICGLWSYTRQTVNSALKGLEKDGYIYLDSVPGNKKSKGIFLTGEGKKLIDEIVVPFIHAENSAFAAMGETERTLLVTLTQKWVSLFREEIQKIKHN